MMRDGTLGHVALDGSRARKAQVYSQHLCGAICG